MKYNKLLKRIAALCACVFVFSSACAEGPGNRLGYGLLKELYSEEGNMVLSPISLLQVLKMAAAGAKGETLSEILDAIGVETVDELNVELPSELESANAVIIRDGLEILPEWQNWVRENCSAEIFPGNENVVDLINEWTREHTRGKIDRLISEPLSDDMVMAILNAVTLEKKWKQPFSEYSTSDGVFYAPGGEVSIPMMNQKEWFDYAERDGVQAICLPYMDSALEMWVLLPAKGDMELLLNDLAENGINAMLDRKELKQVQLSLPKLDVTCETKLNDAMELLGIREAFARTADFSGITPEPVYVDAVLQKTRLKIDEDGTEAAAVTAMVVNKSMSFGEEEIIEMKVDHPYVIVLRDAEKDIACFVGTIVNPS